MAGDLATSNPSLGGAEAELSQRLGLGTVMICGFFFFPFLDSSTVLEPFPRGEAKVISVMFAQP